MPIVIDPPEPSPSPRVYDRGWHPSYWRGSLDEILGAARAALDEIKRQHSEELIFENVHLDFADESMQDLGSLKGLEDVISTVKISEVMGLGIHISAQGNAIASVRIAASSLGLNVSAKGTETFASGMVATVKSRLAGGAEAGEHAARVPLRFIDWFLLALIPAALVGVFVFYTSLKYHDLIGFFLLGVIVPLVPAWLAYFVIDSGQDKRSPPRFALVPEGQQFPDEGDEKTGPIWTAKAWFEEHPAVALMSVLVIGALLGRVADLIKF